MTPDYLEQLARIADPDDLWQTGIFDRDSLSRKQRHQLDTAVALRRYANHVREVQSLLYSGRSLLITPLSENGQAIKKVATPEDHLDLIP